MCYICVCKRSTSLKFWKLSDLLETFILFSASAASFLSLKCVTAACLCRKGSSRQYFQNERIFYDSNGVDMQVVTVIFNASRNGSKKPRIDRGKLVTLGRSLSQVDQKTETLVSYTNCWRNDYEVKIHFDCLRLLFCFLLI